MRGFYKLLTFLGIIGIGILIMLALVKSKPPVEVKPVSVAVPVVRVVTVVKTDAAVVIDAMGTVSAERRVEIQPQVAGRIIWQKPDLAPGSFVREGEVLARIDPRDYELLLEQAKASLASAEVQLKTEKGRGAVAQREWELLGDGMDTTPEGRALALRQPQEESAVAAVNSARSTVKQAELNLERTVIKAPFDAVVLAESIEIGQQVGVSSMLATLAGTDTFRVEALIPQSELAWITVPGINSETGSRVRVSQNQAEWAGAVSGLMGSVDTQGRMARILVVVEDPLNLCANDRGLPLLINSYVKLRIDGRPAAGVFALPLSAVHDGSVWVLDRDSCLSIRDVDVVRGRGDTVLVRGDLEDGELVIVSRIPAPVAGMRLKRFGSDGETNGAEQPDDNAGPAVKGKG